MERRRNNRSKSSPDHIHLLVSIPPKIRNTDMETETIGAEDLNVDTVGKNKKAIAEYI